MQLMAECTFGIKKLRKLKVAKTALLERLHSEATEIRMCLRHFPQPKVHFSQNLGSEDLPQKFALNCEEKINVFFCRFAT